MASSSSEIGNQINDLSVLQKLDEILLKFQAQTNLKVKEDSLHAYEESNDVTNVTISSSSSSEITSEDSSTPSSFSVRICNKSVTVKESILSMVNRDRILSKNKHRKPTFELIEATKSESTTTTSEESRKNTHLLGVIEHAQVNSVTPEDLLLSDTILTDQSPDFFDISLLTPSLTGFTAGLEKNDEFTGSGKSTFTPSGEDSIVDSSLRRIMCTMKLTLLNLKLVPYSIIYTCINRRKRQRCLHSYPGNVFGVVSFFENSSSRINSTSTSSYNGLKFGFLSRLRR